MVQLPDDIKDPNSEYYKQAFEWQEEKYEAAIKHKKAGWLAATIFGGLSIVLAFGVAALAPLKTVEPIVIEVDKVTGETQVRKPVKEGSLTQSEALKRYWLNKYVKARVTYDMQDFLERYNEVKMMSSIEEFARFEKAFDPKKKDSPYQKYGEKGLLTVKVKSISFLKPEVASIRIETTLDKPGEQDAAPVPQIITTSFTFTLNPKTQEERLENPLGFKATQWRIDSEVITGDQL